MVLFLRDKLVFIKNDKIIDVIPSELGGKAWRVHGLSMD